MSERKYILMSIKPNYAALIKTGKKTIELRRVLPKVSSGDVLVIYESMPIKKVTAYCEIEAIILSELEELWKETQYNAYIDYEEFIKYFKGKLYGVGIKLHRVHLLESPKELKEIDVAMRAPQSYRYLTEKQFLNLFL